jgi:protein involved in polysaccharide export with SLBB domain
MFCGFRSRVACLFFYLGWVLTPLTASVSGVEQGFGYSTYKIQKGDLLHFQILEDHNDGKLLLVSESGEIDVPHVGKVQVLGKTCIEVADELEPLLEQKDYKIATVFLQLDPMKKHPLAAPSSQAMPPMHVSPEASKISIFKPAFAAMDDHRFQPGDQIRYRVLEDQEDERILTVSDSGELTVPLVGRIAASGKTTTELISEIKAVLEKKYYNTAHVQLQLDSLGKVRGKVFIYGQVRNPGVHEIVGDLPTLSKAIMAAGGFTEMADRVKVKVVRKNPKEGREEEMVIDVLNIMEKGDPRNDIVLQSEDYVIIPQQSAVTREKIYIYGQVRAPGPQDSQAGELMLSTAILNAGGFSSFADGHKVKIFRKSSKKDDRELIVDIIDVLQKGAFEKDVALQPGDRVMVPEKFINF